MISNSEYFLPPRVILYSASIAAAGKANENAGFLADRSGPVKVRIGG